jgi:hypothetical protein
MRQGKNSQALGQVKEALSLQPDYPEAQQLLRALGN